MSFPSPPLSHNLSLFASLPQTKDKHFYRWHIASKRSLMAFCTDCLRYIKTLLLLKVISLILSQRHIQWLLGDKISTDRSNAPVGKVNNSDWRAKVNWIGVMSRWFVVFQLNWGLEGERSQSQEFNSQCSGCKTALSILKLAKSKHGNVGSWYFLHFCSF